MYKKMEIDKELQKGGVVVSGLYCLYLIYILINKVSEYAKRGFLEVLYEARGKRDEWDVLA
jgi:hypothetical protein